MNNLGARAWLALAVLAALMGLLLFVPAGTGHYWQAWVYLSIFTGASVLTTRYLLRTDPALLERRLSGGPTAEKEPVQRFIMLWVSDMATSWAVPVAHRRLSRGPFRSRWSDWTSNARLKRARNCSCAAVAGGEGGTGGTAPAVPPLVISLSALRDSTPTATAADRSR
jgi:hypothetical protein